MSKLSRKKDNREHLIRNLVTSLILYESIKTTKAKSKKLKSEFDKLVIKAKKNDLMARRHVNGYLFDKNAYKKMFDVIVPRYKTRNSGFTRVLSFSNRLGDNSEINLVELVDKIDSKDSVPDSPETVKDQNAK